ncbi:MAG: nucleoside hydrolase [SAR324 cluster bacterium]|nr:nucleoside hydrolase [SAR324 cluster bacterium]
MKKTKIIIDCDPGLDDAINLLLAFGSPDELEILGITTVAGNVAGELTFLNARIICQLAGFPETKVYRGCTRPLLRDLVTAGEFHGETGLLGVEIFEPETPIQPQHGVDFIIETLLSAEETLTLVPTGPLTNIAMAILKEPEILPKIGEIVLMGGSASAGGNVTPAAEFNIFVDPHAADVVFKCGRPLVLMGLDVTHQAQITGAHVSQLADLNKPVAGFAQTLINSIRQPYLKRYGQDTAPLHDPCTIAYLLKPDLFSGKTVNVAVETQSELCMGATIVDDRQRTERPFNATWMTGLDAEAFFHLILERIARLQ